MKNIIVLAVYMLAIAATVNAYKILVLVPTTEENNWNYMQIFIDKLMNRGHEITCITSQTATHLFQVHRNYTEILIDPPFKVDSGSVHEDVEWFHKEYSSIWTSATVAAESAAWGLADMRVEQFIHRTDLHFDLVINDEYYHESWLMFGRKFRAPIITIASTGHLDFLDHYTGMVTPLSHISHSTLGYGDNMTLTERWCNTWFSLASWFYHNQIHVRLQDQVAERYFSGHLKRLPTVHALIKNVSLILVNAHPQLSPPRPVMPTLIYIGGAHLKRPNKLPKELQTFIDDAIEGVIVVYLEKSFDMATVQIFLDAFRSLKHRVLWHYDNSTVENVPQNVLIYTHFARYDVLNNPNVILYVSSTDFFESIYYSVPVLMLPLNGDQMLKARRIETIGCGLRFKLNGLSVEYLVTSLRKLLRKQSYTSKSIRMSVILRKNQIHPMDRAMYWIEYVVRHKGAKHLQSYGVHLPLPYYLHWEFFVPIIAVLVMGITGLINRLVVRYLIPPDVWNPQQNRN